MTPQEFTTWRKSLGLTQEQMAERLKLSRRTIIHYERGSRRIPSEIATAANQVPAPASNVTPTTCPELYERGYKPGMWVQGQLHPKRLLGPRTGENDYGEPKEIPYTMDVLRSAEYLHARAAAHAGIKARLAFENTTPAIEVFPNALPGESIAQYKNRNSI